MCSAIQRNFHKLIILDPHRDQDDQDDQDDRESVTGCHDTCHVYLFTVPLLPYL